MREVSASHHAHLCSMPLVMCQGFDVWAFNLFDSFLTDMTRGYLTV